MRSALIVSLCSLCALSPTIAAASSFEVTPLIGHADGTFRLDTGIVCVQAPCPSYLESEDGAVLGMILDYRLSPRVDFELLVGRQDSELGYTTSFDSSTRVALPTVDLDIDHLEIGLRRRWIVGRTEPFAAFGVGISRVVSDSFVGTRIDDDRSTFSLAAGTRIGLGEKLGLRLELRHRRIDLPAGFQDAGGIALRYAGEDLEQLQYAAGLSVGI